MSESSVMSDPVSEDGCSAQDVVAQEMAEQSVEGQKEVAPTPEESAVTAEAEPTEEVASIASTELIKTTTAEESDSQSTAESVAVPPADSIPTDAPTVETAPSEISSQTLPSSQDASQPRNSWISNRRSASFRYTEEYTHETIAFPNPPQPAPPVAEPAPSTRPLKRTHSFVRLSMADDGTARVITDADKTPSPPHAKSNPALFARAAAGLRRSYSAAGLNERLAAVSRGEPSPKIARTTSTFGQSRDSRAWEFWCDPETRNSGRLTSKADQEGSGSAADAIAGLVRSNRRVLGQNQARQNASLLSRGESARVLGEQGYKKSRGLQRSSTSAGRLQTKAKKNADSSETDELPQTESDKENWEPENPKSHRARQQAPPSNSQRQRQVLRENTEIMSQSSSLGAMLAKERRKLGREDTDPEQVDELRQFMNGGAPNLSSSEEVGCVEGLLKLSQGNWR